MPVFAKLASLPRRYLAVARGWRRWAIIALGIAPPGLILADDDLASQVRQPGISAEYLEGRGGAGSAPSVQRVETSPQLSLSAGQAPDSRLPPTGWRARWSGVIEVLQPGVHQFHARASGKLTVRVGEQVVLARPAQDPRAAAGELVAGPRVELGFGLHPLIVEFEPAGDGAELKLSWESEHFPREPLSARSVGHAVTEAEAERAQQAGLSPDRLFAADTYLAGRLAVEEQSCVSCHRPSSAAPISHQLAHRPGPHLTHAGDRLKEAWVYQWLGDPQKLRPEAVMPRLFGSDRQGEIERRAVARFLAERKDPQRPAPDAPAAAAEEIPGRGKQHFERLGCIACHRGAPERPPRATLRGLGEKTTASCLAEFLQQPAKFDPAGRMPDLQLSRDEAAALAAYLTSPKTEPIEPLSLPDAPSSAEIASVWHALGQEPTDLSDASPERQLAQLGREVLRARQCTSCHELKIAGEEDFWAPRPAQADFAQLARRAAAPGELPGCFATGEQPAASPRRHPEYSAILDRDAVRTFLAAALDAPGTPAPAEAARLALARFNCQACHERDGIGGLAPDFVNVISANQGAQEAELVKPPTLSGITEKLLAKPLDEVLTGDRRSRPWMSVRMPRFGREHVGHLAAALAALEATTAATATAAPAPDAPLAEAGRQLVGGQGFGCTKCHDLLGKPSGGTRGPDLALVPERIHYDWFQRWMTDPQRIEPGTRMPTVFLKGESPYPSILGGDPARQREAIWQYLVASRELPLPAGLEATPTTAGTPASDRVFVARTFLPELSARSLAIRFPSSLQLAYDAQSCRLAYAWRGDFLDMTPVWTERGGRQARPLAPVCWRSPAGFPWEITAADSTALPNFAGRANDTSLGAPLPDDAQLHPSRLHFRGYHTDAAGVTFRYDLDLPEKQQASFTERLTTSADELASGIVRQIEVASPSPSQVTLLVADSPRPIVQILDDPARSPPSGAGATEPVSLPGDAQFWIADEAGPVIYRLAQGADSARWSIVQRDGHSWLLLQGKTQAPPESAAADPRARVGFALEALLPVDASAEGVDRVLKSPRERNR
ncbi:MAG: c-type cytochrome [Planctomycetaceae bacterium]|nr:c-type cytochrome [Planctomycetaceae bacterium]